MSPTRYPVCFNHINNKDRSALRQAQQDLRICEEKLNQATQHARKVESELAGERARNRDIQNEQAAAILYWRRRNLIHDLATFTLGAFVAAAVMTMILMAAG